MGKKHNLITRIRSTLQGAALHGAKVDKKKLIAMIILEGVARRTAREYVQAFIEAGEASQTIENGEEVLEYAKTK